MPKNRAFRRIEYPIVGGSYQDDSKPLSQQRTVNMYLEVTKSGRTDTDLKSWPGLKLWSSGVVGEFDRGIYSKTFMGVGWQVAGNTLYSISSSGVKTSIGSISGSDQVTFADNGVVLVIVGGGVAYSCDGASTSVLSYAFTPLTVAYLNNQFFYGASDGRVYITTAGTTSVLDGNSFSPDSDSDDLVNCYVFDQFLMNFSQRTIEPWENTGSGIPPVERMDGVIQEETGLAGKDAVGNSSRAVYFLGSDNEPHRMVNFQTVKIGDPAVSKAIQGYGDNASCRVFRASFGSQDFIQFHFPTARKVWMYSEQTEIWVELEHDTDGSRYIGNSIARLFNKNIVGDYRNGNLYELDANTYQNNSVQMARERVGRPLSGEQFGTPRQRTQYSEIGFSVGTGVGNNASVNPLVSTQISTDGVKFGSQVWHELGREGVFQQDIFHSTNKNCTDMAVKVRCTDNCDFAIYTAYADIREAGR
ncbi:MAG TPA: hypothetical protein EYN14_09360 [Alphaproteobacteria bacterium]|nr:hypothetical protein [Alphaproteobacteria bacterium]